MSWIKIDTTLVNKPKVVTAAIMLKMKREEMLGYIVKFWCLTDALTEDGMLPGYTKVAVDDLVGLKGFAKALESVGWLEFSKSGCKITKFDKHNGSSAKKRAMHASQMSRIRSHKCDDNNITQTSQGASPRVRVRSKDSGESLPGAGVCTPTREDSHSQVSSSRPDIREALGLGGQQEWPEDEVEKWWLWNDARGWRDVVNWRSSLAMWMKRVRPESSEPNGPNAKISAPPSALEMDVSVEVE